jgi:Tol biopolymer transport system component
MDTHHFGEEVLVYDAASQDKSATLPRISPDGHYLLFALGQYGCFHIRHSDSDIVCMPLDNQVSSDIDLTGLNSEGFADSYPTWSSNGHWIMTSSRRGDGNYSRVYISYFNNGKTRKAFMLPQEDPEHNTWRLKCYNRPEFMVEPVRISVNEFSKVFK